MFSMQPFELIIAGGVFCVVISVLTGCIVSVIRAFRGEKILPDE